MSGRKSAAHRSKSVTSSKQVPAARQLRTSVADAGERATQLHKTGHAVEQGINDLHEQTEETHLKARAISHSQKKLSEKNAFPIVGIGASAGGLEAMTQLLRHLPRDTGMAYVLIQHLDPTHESQLSMLLSRSTSMRVSESKHNLELERNHLYIIPPNKMMGISERRLKLLPRKHDKEMRMPIDYFLRTLAEQEGSSAIGVVLSGNGSDGTVGLQAIKAGGGTTFAQDEVSAKYPNMPGSAIAAQCVDFALPPDKIARELTRIARHPYVTPSKALKRDRASLTEDQAFDDILTTLRQRMGVDFTHYKHATLRRRIQRRIMLRKLEKLRDYANYVHSHPDEAKELFNDILIHVTGFFRDRTVFTVLKKRVFPSLLKGKTQNDSIRIWVPGCSTGEEVYSIAIALIEALTANHLNVPVQIFGTDINDLALEKARSGVYPDRIQKEISPERLRRFFVRQKNGYRINKSVRELCIFARQNVVVDPPFSSLDLISCRNVLIYLGQPLQRKILPIFHYALKPTGLLLLGASETVGSFPELFALRDRKAKIYGKKATSIRPAVTFQSFLPPPEKDRPEELVKVSPSLNDLKREADRLLLSHFCPAGVVINEAMDVLQFRGRTAAFLEHEHGEASLNLLKMAREGLEMHLRSAISKAIQQNSRIRQEGARVRQNNHFVEVTIEVVPLKIDSSRERFFLVLLESSRETAREDEGRRKRGGKIKARRSDTEIAQLRDELAGTRESLQAIIEEQEATNEELRSANEEIMSSNEELQSTNEELETAKEELQSTNEELTTLNEEMETRNIELRHLNDDLQNIMESVDIPMIILGRDLRIRRFTAVAEKVLNLISGDIGRPMTDIALKVDLPNLPDLVTEVIDSFQTKNVEARDNKGRFWSVRIRPYKTMENKIDGAIIALVDIDAMRSSLKQSNEGRAFAEGIINTVRESLVVLDSELIVRHVNESFLATFKVKRSDAVHRRIYELREGEWDIPKLRQLLEEILPKNQTFHDFMVEHTFPDVGKKKLLLNARRLVFDGDSQPMILLAIEDITGPNQPASPVKK
jgi:two-component system CheB/CheR fusion protein